MTSSTKPLVLIVEDELPIRRFLNASLTEADYRINEAASAAEANRVAMDPVPDLILLDLGLPDLDGQTFLARLREWYQGPILVLSARDQETQKVLALDNGADDYVTKPFSTAELLARVRSLLRRRNSKAASESTAMKLGDVEIHLVNRTVQRAGNDIHLTPLEYKLLTVFLKHPHKVLTHRFLLQEVWGPQGDGELHYVRIFVASLRRKLEVDSAHPKFFLTEPGVGYRMVLE